jgi:hypothetical protein
MFIINSLSNMGAKYRPMLTNALFSATTVIKKLVERGNTAYIPTLKQLFSETRSTYRSRKGTHKDIPAYKDVPGNPEVRERCVQIFGVEGFENLLAFVNNSDFAGCATASHILSLFSSGKAVLNLSPDVIQTVYDWAIRSVSELSDEELKKEPTENINSLLVSVRYLAGNGKSSFEFWMAMTLKFLRSNSLPQVCFQLGPNLRSLFYFC